MNPITLIPKLLKSKPLIDGLEKDFKTMNKSNWKTNILGIVVLGIGLARIWAPADYQGKVQQTQEVLMNCGLLGAGAGLLAAKDHNN